MNRFNLYETVAVLIPGGMWVAFLFLGNEGRLYEKEGAALATIIFIIASYIVGQLLQTFGRLIERKGLKKMFPQLEEPTDRLRSGVGMGKDYLTEKQVKDLEEKLRSLKLLVSDKSIKNLNYDEWWSVTQQVRLATMLSKEYETISRYQSMYSFNRGLWVSALMGSLFSLGSCLFLSRGDMAVAALTGIFLLFMFVIFFMEAISFKNHYAQNLFLLFLRLPITVGKISGAIVWSHEESNHQE